MTHRRDSITAEMLEARRAGKLDQRCRSCGVTSAATEYCCACHGTDLEYRIHLPSRSPKHPELPVVVQWCQQDGAPRKVDPVRRARALSVWSSRKARGPDKVRSGILTPLP